MTISEMHMAINLGVQKVASFQVDTILIEEMDLEINKSIERFVNQRYNKFGKYTYDYSEGQYDYPYNNKPFPLEGPITEDGESDTSLKINIVSNQIETNVLDDYSGNQNYGFAYSDYRPKFDSKTVEAKKIKRTNIIRKSKNNGAY